MKLTISEKKQALKWSNLLVQSDDFKKHTQTIDLELEQKIRDIENGLNLELVCCWFEKNNWRTL